MTDQALAQEAEMPTWEQFKETANRFRTIVEYGLSGALVGDNEIARAAIACDLVADALAQHGNDAMNSAFFSLLKSMAKPPERKPCPHGIITALSCSKCNPF